VLVTTGVSAHHTLAAVVLITFLTVVAITAGVDEAANTDSLTDLELGDILADLDSVASDLVTWDHWENTWTPLLSGLMDVGVADTSPFDLDVHIVITTSAALYGVGLQLGSSCLGCPGLAFERSRFLHLF
jgi:hypothetical protein